MNEQEILDFIKKEGPVFPIKISSKFSMDSFTASAILSDFVSRGLIKSTFGVIGSSKLFYAQGQEMKARSMIFDKLDDLGKMFVKMMNEHKIVLESELGAQERFLAAKMRDFANPNKIQINGKEEIVWAFSNLTKDEVVNEINRRFKKPELPTPVPQAPLPTSIQQQIIKKSEPQIEQPKPELKKQDSEFENKVNSYFRAKNIEIFEKQFERKNKEFQFLVKIPSIIGEQEFYVKAKSKKTIKEEDLSLAWLEAQKQKKPLIFVTDGKISAKVLKFAETKLGNLVKVVAV